MEKEEILNDVIKRVTECRTLYYQFFDVGFDVIIRPAIVEEGQLEGHYYLEFLYRPYHSSVGLHVWTIVYSDEKYNYADLPEEKRIPQLIEDVFVGLLKNFDAFVKWSETIMDQLYDIDKEHGFSIEEVCGKCSSQKAIMPDFGSTKVFFEEKDYIWSKCDCLLSE